MLSETPSTSILGLGKEFKRDKKRETPWQDTYCLLQNPLRVVGIEGAASFFPVLPPAASLLNVTVTVERGKLSLATS